VVTPQKQKGEKPENNNSKTQDWIREKELLTRIHELQWLKCQQINFDRRVLRSHRKIKEQNIKTCVATQVLPTLSECSDSRSF